MLPKDVRGVRVALETMRRAETGKRGLELQQELNDARVKEGLERTFAERALLSKKNKKKILRLSENISEAEEAKRQESKKLIENLVSRPPVLRGLGQLRGLAKTFWAHERHEKREEEKKVDKKAKAGRSSKIIFPEIIAAVKRLHDENLLDAPIERPAVIMHRRPASSASRVRKPSCVSSSNQAHAERIEREAEEEEKEGKTRPKSANAALRRALALQKRDELQRQREMDVLESIQSKLSRGEARFEAQKLEHLQRAYLVLVNTLRFERAFLGVFEQIQQRREQHRELKKSRGTKLRSPAWAVDFIGKWWWHTRLQLRFKRNAWAIRIIARAVRKWRVTLQEHRRHRAVNLIKRFIRDASRMGDKVKFLVGFRNRVIKIQTWVREWISIQENRLFTLNLVFERIKAARRADALRRHKKAEKMSMKSMAVLEGFGNSLLNIKKVQIRINNIFSDVDAKKKHWAYSEHQLEHEHHHLQHNNNEDGGHHQHHSKVRSWVRHMRGGMSSMSDRLNDLRFILLSQRKRHMLRLKETQQLLTKAERIVNEEALREFLSRPDDHKAQDKIFEVLDKNGKRVEEVSNVSAMPPFLLLSGKDGAVSYLHAQPDGYFS